MLQALIVAILIAAPLADESGTHSLRTEGHARGTGIIAHTQALDDAKRVAVLETLVRIVPTKDLAPFRPILERSGRYIRSFQELEYTEARNETRVEIEVRVTENLLRRDAAALLLPRLPTPPKVLVLIAHTTEEGKPWNPQLPGPAELAILERLRDADFETLDPALLRKRYTPPDLVERITDQAGQPGRFPLENAVALAITGHARSAVRGADGAGLHTCRATLTVRVARAGYDKVVATHTARGVVHTRDAAMGTRQALLDAIARVWPDLSASCVLAVAGAEPPEDLVLTVEDPGTQERIQEIAGRIAAFPGVDAVDPLHYADVWTRLQVKYDGDPAPLAKHLIRQDYSDFRLEPRVIVGRDMTFTVAPLDAPPSNLPRAAKTPGDSGEAPSSSSQP